VPPMRDAAPPKLAMARAMAGRRVSLPEIVK
jgi:hypothetical protein